MRRLDFLVVVAAITMATNFTSVAAPPASATPDYKVTKSVPLGAPDRWDSVVFDPASHRVFVAHGDRVTVVDGHDGSIIGEVDGYPGGTHGIAISPAAGRGYTDDGRAGIAGSFDLATLKPLNKIAAEADADGIVFDPVSGHIFVIDGDSGKVTVIDPGTDTAVATIDGGGKLEFGVAGGNGRLYINGAEKQEIVRIDTKTNRVDAHWSMANCTSPHGLAMDSATHRLFSSCVNNVLVVVDADDGSTVATVPIGSGTDGAAFDPKRKLIFSSNGRDGTLSVIQERDAKTFVPVATIKTVISGRTMDIDPQTGRLYVAAADIDPNAPLVNGRRPPVPGSLKLLFLDPSPE